MENWEETHAVVIWWNAAEYAITASLETSKMLNLSKTWWKLRDWEIKIKRNG